MSEPPPTTPKPSSQPKPKRSSVKKPCIGQITFVTNLQWKRHYRPHGWAVKQLKVHNKTRVRCACARTICTASQGVRRLSGGRRESVGGLQNKVPSRVERNRQTWVNWLLLHHVIQLQNSACADIFPMIKRGPLTLDNLTTRWHMFKTPECLMLARRAASLFSTKR